MIVFAIETSCDETSVCIINKKKILSHIIYSQTEHQKFGGVIPELAARSHLEILQKITKDALFESKIQINQVDIFCATCGPGLIGGLLVGSIFAKALAIGAKKPFMAINHLEGHLLSPTYNNKITYPYACFLLTGGHTQIYLIKNINNYELLGETRDDAIGEAFDKVAKLINLNYPGGPLIEKNAKKGNINFYSLPHPLINEKIMDFSFSGIKTAVNLLVKKQHKINKIFIRNLTASFQQKITEILDAKLKLTFEYLQNKNIIITQMSLVGGVAANKYIYEQIKKTASINNCSLIMPRKYMLSDNAAMIGWACIQKYKKEFTSDLHFEANPRLTIKDSN